MAQAAAASNNIVPVVPDETKQEITTLAELANQSRALVIADQAGYQSAADLLRDIKDRGKELEKKRKAITEPMDAAKKATMDMFRPAVDAIESLEKLIKGRMSDFVREQERLVREAEAQARENQRKEQERLHKQAEALRAKGKDEKAEAIEQQAATTVAMPATHMQATASGASHRKIWKAKLTDKMALIKAVAEGRASAELLDYNESVGNKLATALKSSLCIPGLDAYDEISIASR